MSAKDEILGKLRRVETPEAPLPELDGPWHRYDDPDRQFADLVAVVGGVCHEVSQWSQAREILEALPVVAAAGGLDSSSLRICSLVPELPMGGVHLEQIDDPHDLQDVDLAVVRGEFGIAENGAIWITDQGVRHRAVFVLPQHLAVVIPGDGLVHNLHEAYARLTMPRQGGFGMLLSGPSKTADIEQSLVIGAHGARSVTVIRASC